uniref:SF3 helicase domain-containing protein n=1 Tax=viral metagenome TaxID=1070528 RepID=A0A6C0JVI1_9ZZZZ
MSKFFEWADDLSGATHVHDGETVIVPREEFTGMMTEYCDAIYKDVPYTADYVELSKSSFCPLVVDVKMTFRDIADDEDPFNDRFIMMVTSCCQQTIVDVYTTSQNQDELNAVVLRTYPTIMTKETTSHIRIWFPYAVTGDTRSLVDYQVELVKNLRQHNIMTSLEYLPLGNLDDSVSIMKKKYPMYLSQEEDGPLYYYYTLLAMEPVATSSLSEDVPITDYTIELGDIFSYTTHSLIDEMDEIDDAAYYLPVILSPSYYNNTMKFNYIEKGVASSLKYHKLYQLPSDVSMERVESNSYIRAMAKNFLNMIGDHRYYSQTNWEDVGMCIYNSYNGEMDGLTLWIECSEKAYKNGRPEFIDILSRAMGGLSYSMESMYLTFRHNNHLTYKTLAWFASKDSPERYSWWHHNWICSALAMCLPNREDTLVAQLIYRVFWLDVMYSNKMWYMFMNGFWRKCPDGDKVRREISCVMVDILEKKKVELSNDAPRANATDKAKINTMLEDICKLTSSFLNVACKSKYMKELKPYLEVDDLANKTDTNVYVLGLLNGILDLKGDAPIHRSAKPEDYVTKCTGVLYREYSWKDRGVEFVMDWLRKMFPNNETLEYFLKICAYILVGTNPHRLLIIILGVMGSEGKSVLARALKDVLGDYAISLPSSAYKQDSKRGGACPELARAKGCRAVITSEVTEESEKLRDDVAKAIAGQDIMFQRGLYQDGGDMVPTFMSIFLSNVEIEFNRMDSAMKDRIVLFNLKTRFFSLHSNDPNRVCPKDPEEQRRRRIYPRDNKFPDKIAAHASHFLWIISQYHCLVVNEGLAMPKEVMDDTNEYTESQDYYSAFKKLYIEADVDAYLPTGDLIDTFNTWFRIEYPYEARPPRPKHIINNISTFLGRVTGDGWEGYTLKKGYEDDSDDGY